MTLQRLQIKNKYLKTSSKQKKRILVAPLNWGLGHATRCIPIINELINQGVEVIVASDGTALTLLKKEFPQLTFVKLPAYNVTYQTSNMIWNMATQIPKIVFAMVREFFALQQIIKNHQIDAIITDNRFGCWTWKVPTVFMTHQVNIKIPNSILQFFVNQSNHLILRLFNTIWIPDVSKTPNLAGDLAHNFPIQHFQYVGVLSRMKPLKVGIRYDIGIILSGPEPQRTYLEEQLLRQVYDFQSKNPLTKVLFVKGKMSLEELETTGNLEIHGYLTTKELNQKMAACRLIVARSGYSTIMDLVAMNKKAILIPTPGQTEQEYLANLYKNQQIFYTQAQSEFELAKAISESKKYQGFQTNLQEKALLKNEVKRFITSLS